MNLGALLVSVVIAVISLMGSGFAVYQNRQTEDRKTDLSEFQSIVDYLKGDNRDLRAENQQYRDRLKELEMKNLELERRVLELERNKNEGLS